MTTELPLRLLRPVAADTSSVFFLFMPFALPPLVLVRKIGLSLICFSLLRRLSSAFMESKQTDTQTERWRETLGAE